MFINTLYKMFSFIAVPQHDSTVWCFQCRLHVHAEVGLALFSDLPSTLFAAETKPLPAVLHS